MIRTRSLATMALAGLTLTACAPEDSASSGSTQAAEGASAAAACTKESLQTLQPGTLTIATGDPAFEPWVEDDSPESGEGFEAAVAYAAAEELGFATEDVRWVRTTFEGAIAPGPKDFDWNIQQFTITEDREEAVDFSTSYYDAPQAVITYKGSPIDGATTLADLKDAKLGASVGSTSLDAAQLIGSSQEVAPFNDNAGAVTALKNKQIDGIVVDLPTGFHLVASEIDGGTMVGQLPPAEGQPLDQYAILMANNSPLTACTAQAVDQLRADGTLGTLRTTWLPDATAATLQ